MYRIQPLIFLALCTLTGCQHNSTAELPQGDTLTAQSNLLTIVDAGDYYVADIANPWAANTSLLECYILAPRDFDGALPQGSVIRIPLANSIVYSGVHGGAIDELGAIDAIAAVADGMYFTNPSLSTRITDGTIKDVGNSMSPSQEMIIDINPDAILLSPYQDQNLGAVGKLGIPLIQLVDYMESTPLGRAEWIKLLGILYGASSQADSIYQKVTADYTALRDKAALTQNRPKVITEQPPFHPERLLADYIAIFHPDIIPELKPRYFQKAQ